MDGMLYKATCDPDCAFMVQGHDKMEVANVIKNHANEMHGANISSEEAEKKVMAI